MVGVLFKSVTTRELHNLERDVSGGTGRGERRCSTKMTIPEAVRRSHRIHTPNCVIDCGRL